ncbi:aminopeptidase N [Ectothiorhodospira mobilis]|uniref:Aminopeptidase N n=1 Tax=Ectothiorhodospira mobilis TaxID=195064 RepID=A0A1I4P8I5_ECTMO|nr:aminopeptidase N [Ectothiorhodospira mobilis]SFM24108.1 aminopeptidase N [Ectothiorhodospira mobilis]
MKDATPRAIRLEDYAPPQWRVDTVHLDFDLDPERTRVRSRMELTRLVDGSAPLVLNGQDLGLEGLQVDGRDWPEDRRSLEPERLVLHDLPATCVVELETVLEPRANTALEGLYVSGGNFCTQCEAEGFRRITWFPDRPDVLTVYTVRLEADRATCPVLLSNGNPVETGDLPGGRHYAVWHDPFPKPSYLFALVAGDLVCQQDRFTTRSGREVDLRIYVQRHNLDRCDHAMVSLKKAMRWDEETFGREYDLDIYMIVAVDDFNMGAMENKGLNVFNSKYVLARPETATDDDFVAIEGVIAHEYFHNWSGNRVTCRDWFQLSLKEGLTVFRDQEFTADQSLRAVKRIHDVQHLRSLQFPEDAGPMAHPVRPRSYIEINNFYTMTVYEKGAEVVRMIQTLVGREGFRRGLDLYFQRHDGQAVTTEDFVRAMEDATGRDLGPFRLWYEQAGTPRLEVDGHHDAATATYRLTVRQSCPPTPDQPEKRPMHIPLRMALLDPSGRPLPLRLHGDGDGEAPPVERVLDVTEAEQTFVFQGVEAPPVPSLLRGFSAPVKLQFPYTHEDLAFLMAHDGDDFNRWEAGQQLAVKVLLAQVRALQAGEEPRLDPALEAAFARVLEDEALDAALVAEALTLPGEGYLAEQMEVVDVDAIHRARRFTRQALGRALAGRWRARHDALADSRGGDAVAMGRRRLRDLCLAYLCAPGEKEALALARSRYEQAQDMTGTMGALRALMDHPGPERDEALADFEARWRQDPLVLDKWFALQAASGAPGTRERVEALMAHPGFSLRNPNRVRALLGTFAMGNPVHFHAADGEGYRLVTEAILELDALNPQVAARLATSLVRWRRFDAARQERMRAALERIVARPGGSPDVYEVASRALA